MEDPALVQGNQDHISRQTYLINCGGERWPGAAGQAGGGPGEMVRWMWAVVPRGQASITGLLCAPCTPRPHLAPGGEATTR